MQFSPQGVPLGIPMAQYPQQQARPSRTMMGGTMAEMMGPMAPAQGAVDESSIYGQLPAWAQGYFDAQMQGGGTYEDRISQFLPQFQAIQSRLAGSDREVPFAFEGGNFSSPLTGSTFGSPSWVRGSNNVLRQARASVDPITGAQIGGYEFTGNYMMMPSEDSRRYTVNKRFRPDGFNEERFNADLSAYNQALQSAAQYSGPINYAQGVMPVNPYGNMRVFR